MKNYTTPDFWHKYNLLPPHICKLADKNFELLKNNSTHPSLHLKKVANYWSVRIGINYRAIAIQINEGLLWFWIGSHNEYNKIVKA